MHLPRPPNFLRHAGSRMLAALLALLCCLAGSPSSTTTHAAERAAGENQIKAAFLSNFAKFITWQGPRPHAGEEFAIAVFGDAPFAEELRAVVRGRSIGGRLVRVRLVHVLADAAAMDVLFIPEGLEDEARPHLPRLGRLGVLTVGESQRCAEIGGIINFQMQSGKIKFSINRRAADEAGLKVSPQLLKLAIMEGGAAR